MTSTSAASHNRGEEGGSFTTYREIIVDILKENPDGLSKDEIFHRVKAVRRGMVDKQSIHPRMRELERKGQVERTGITRTGDAGNAQIVWRYKETQPDPFTVRAGFLQLWTTDKKAEKKQYMVEAPSGRSPAFDTLEEAHEHIRSLTFGDKIRKGSAKDE